MQEQANRLAEATGEITREMLCEITAQDARAAISGEDAAQEEREAQALTETGGTAATEEQN